MSTITEGIQRAIHGRYPLVYLVTWEEDRALKLLKWYSSQVFKGLERGVTTWSCVQGFRGAISGEHQTFDPVKAISAVSAVEGPGFFVFQDLAPFMSKPEVQRALREAYHDLRSSEKYIFITSPELTIPESLQKEALVIEMGLPEESEINKLVEHYRQQVAAETLTDDLVREMSFALKGLTMNEATHTLNRVFRSKDFSREQILEEIFKDKETVVKKAGFLEFVPPTADIDGMGGLENLKDWLKRRSKLFSREAMDKGMPTPRGMLVMGMSGCGKSLAAKVVSSLWGIPLFRLDMNLVISGLYGTPEAAFHRALKTIEALAPAVLWIDEIENALGMEDDRSQANAQIFSSFLTWMQEKPPLIFVAATANRINALPAEVIRKGRFDQVFFVDLPIEPERRQIFDIHLRRNGADPANFDLEILAIATRGWNGAEIEQAVVAARVDAFDDGRSFEMSDVTRNTAGSVPLSKTMHEQMKKIRSWAFGRATLASGSKYDEN